MLGPRPSKNTCQSTQITFISLTFLNFRILCTTIISHSLKTFLLSYFSVYECFVCTCACASCVCLLPHGKKRAWLPWNWSYRWLWVIFCCKLIIPLLLIGNICTCACICLWILCTQFLSFSLCSSFFSHTMQPTTAPSPFSLPSSQPLTFPLPQIHRSSIFLQKRAGLSGISTKHSIIRYNKSRHKPSHQGWTRQSNSRKGVSRTGKSERQPHSHC